MPSRSKHKKGKYSPQRSQPKPVPARPESPSVAAAGLQGGTPRPKAAGATSGPQVAAPRPRTAAAPAPAAPVALPQSYATISTELKTIGIMAGVMLVALIVLALVMR